MKKLLHLIGLTIFCSFVINTTSEAQTKVDSTQLTLQRYAHYWGIEEKISSNTLKKLSFWLDSAENKQLPPKTRIASYQKLYSGLNEAFQDADVQQVIPTYANMSFANNTKLEWMNEPKKFTPDGQLGSVKKIGNGSVAIIAIAAPSYDGREFQKIIEAFKDICTFWVITLPGSGGTAPYKLPAQKSIASRAWLSNVVTGIQALIKKEKINQFYLLTHSFSFPVTLLLNETPVKSNILGAVSLRSRVSEIHIPMKAESTEDIAHRLNYRFPIGDFTRANFALGTTFSNKEAFDMEMAKSAFNQLNSLTSSYIHARYLDEASTIDINDYLPKINYPILIINPLYDPAIPAQVVMNNRMEQASWQKVKINNPNASLHLSFIQARDFFFVENSNEINRQLFSFITKDYSSFNGKSKPTDVVMVSPEASITQTFSNTDVTINYSMPAVKNRAIFGTLIPYGKLWRAGANEGSEITFTRDVKINGSVLKSGSYSLFVIPEEKEWMFIFNKITRQWATSQYNEKFDALRVKADIETISKQERLTYNFENLTDKSVDLTLSWDTKKAKLNLEEVFTKPLAESRIINFPWKKLLKDTVGDHRNKNSADGKALSYYYDQKNDSLWFKFETYAGINQLSPAISISLDTDNNQNNGVNWYGTNRQFKVDLMISVGVTRQGEGYEGYNGLTDAKGIQISNWTNVKKNCVKFYFDAKEQDFYICLKKSDMLKPEQKKINLIGSVGANATWNDDIGKEGAFATLEFE